MGIDVRPLLWAIVVLFATTVFSCGSCVAQSAGIRFPLTIEWRGF